MDPITPILSSPIVSQASTALTLADVTVKLGKSINRPRFLFNLCRPALRIAVFGSSGSGKSSFLGLIKGKHYDGESTRYREVVKFTLPNGRRIHFHDCPGQVSYRSERTALKNEISNGKFHAIINVVCFGYNETANMSVKIFDGKGNIKPEFMENNMKLELDQLKEWIYDINIKSKIKWILTLINKEDIWRGDSEKVNAYYESGEYAGIINELNRICKLHILPFCSKISPFGGQPMVLRFSDRDKFARCEELIANIIQFIEKN